MSMRAAILLIVVAIIVYLCGSGLLLFADEFGWRLVGVVMGPFAIPLAIWGGRALRIHRERSAQTSLSEEGGR